MMTINDERRGLKIYFIQSHFCNLRSKPFFNSEYNDFFQISEFRLVLISVAYIKMTRKNNIARDIVYCV